MTKCELDLVTHLRAGELAKWRARLKADVAGQPHGDVRLCRAFIEDWRTIVPGRLPAYFRVARKALLNHRDGVRA